MGYVKINGLTLRFDWGTVLLISAETKVEGTNPLIGVPAVEEGKYILYGALARASERADEPIEITVEKAGKMIKDFSASQYDALIKCFIKLMQVDPDEDVSKEAEGEPVKAKKK